MDNTLIIRIAYLVAAVLFIVGIKLLGKTPTAKKGNTLSATAMLIAILATLLDNQIVSFTEILATILLASAIGVYAARKVEMTSMPEMIALLNGFGGLASALVSTSEYWRMTQETSIGLNTVVGISMALSIIIGALTFTGSMVAFGKLKGIISGKAVVFVGQHYINLMLLVAVAVFSVLLIINPTAPVWAFSILGIALILGILAVIPIGGADMPVVIALLNSYTGIAAAATGFVLNNEVLIITGAIVGTAGLILTQIMCKAMNRSLINVVLGGFGQTTGAGGDTDGEEIVVKEVGVEESAMLFDSVSSAIIVPGYGMAVAQAQHAIRELSELLEKRNVNVRFAIHPVAGRMPGHMNVLLAEANIPYDKLIEMEAINDDFANTDLVFVVGANDVVNPAAKTNPDSPIFGMPVLNVEKAQTVIVSKRSMGKGYAGIENELFGEDNCLMLFGDAKQTITKLVGELKEMG